MAEKYGVNAAIILENFAYWIAKNEANGKHFHNGLYWTYNSVKAFQALFPYMSEKSIRNAIKTLIDEGLIVDGEFNDLPCDRTKWYAITKKGKCIWSKGQMELPERANGVAQKGEPIPDNKPDNKPNNKQERSTRKKFVPPTLEEVTDYCKQRNSTVDPKKFYDYFSAGDWVDSKGKPVTSWKQKIITWEGRGNNGQSVHGNTQASPKKFDVHYDNEI